MKSFHWTGFSALAAVALYGRLPSVAEAASSVISPKIVILSMYADEAGSWYDIPEFNVLEKNYTIPGLSPVYPSLHCTADGQICQLTTGEGEANAAVSVATLAFSPLLNLTQTYFMIAGIAGINPKVASVGSVTFARYAVHVGLQYEIDAREIPSNWSTGYFAQDATQPGEFPGVFYGTEVYEVNDALRQLAYSAAKTATLSDSPDSTPLRANYSKNPEYKAGSEPIWEANVYLCDTATSDTYWDGDLLGVAFEGTVSVFTGGQGVYCSTQQEDNATLQALLRAAIVKRVDFNRIIIMRTASDFDRQYPGQSVVASLLGPEPGYEDSIANIHIAGVKVVEMVLDGWGSQFAGGVLAGNYVGDVFGSLGGKPDFIPPASAQAVGRKRGYSRRR
ncbi:Purine nucleoside permease protein [Mycena chlorophos]|uniref:Purine nucleoside permease protein n=1 Tax=Mycena chlorophos TaxID=658473 RepID=A0A8H6WNE1_MYCCL|nr:Purine nucleoside permease protein [Mycena chlorophos]